MFESLSLKFAIMFSLNFKFALMDEERYYRMLCNQFDLSVNLTSGSLSNNTC